MPQAAGAGNIRVARMPHFRGGDPIAMQPMVDRLPDLLLAGYSG